MDPCHQNQPDRGEARGERGGGLGPHHRGAAPAGGPGNWRAAAGPRSKAGGAAPVAALLAVTAVIVAATSTWWLVLGPEPAVARPGDPAGDAAGPCAGLPGWGHGARGADHPGAWHRPPRRARCHRTAAGRLTRHSS